MRLKDEAVGTKDLYMLDPVKITEQDAIDRNTDAERELLEQSPTNPISQRGADWIAFAKQVLDHIEDYTVLQYGDKGDDQATDWSVEMLIEQTKKYANRYGKNQRPGQETLDFMKGAHYLQLAFNKFMECGPTSAGCSCKDIDDIDPKCTLHGVL